MYGNLFNWCWVGKSCNEAGIKDFRFHDLRDDFCSKLVQKGADLYSVAGLAGHKDTKITQGLARKSYDLHVCIPHRNTPSDDGYAFHKLSLSLQGCKNINFSFVSS